jgi:hypothetical protein
VFCIFVGFFYGFVLAPHILEVKNRFTTYTALTTRQNHISKNRFRSSILILSLQIWCIRNNNCILLTERVNIRNKYFILHNMTLHDIIVIFDGKDIGFCLVIRAVQQNIEFINMILLTVAYSYIKYYCYFIACTFNVQRRQGWMNVLSCLFPYSLKTV